MIIFAVLSLFIANLVPLSTIATMGSAGFLIIFLMVNISNIKLHSSTKSIRSISLLGALACLVAIALLLYSTYTNPKTSWEIFVLIGMIVFSILVEVIYEICTGRIYNL